MTERSYQDAVQVLNGRIGARWDGLEAEGRTEMARILKAELGYDDRQANDAIDAMVATGAIRYHPAGAAAGIPVIPPPGSGGVIEHGLPITGAAAAGLPNQNGDDSGYWQIGAGVIESSERKGQVQ